MLEFFRRFILKAVKTFIKESYNFFNFFAMVHTYFAAFSAGLRKTEETDKINTSIWYAEQDVYVKSYLFEKETKPSNLDFTAIK